MGKENRCHACELSERNAELQAELAAAGVQWAKDMAFYSQQVHDLKAELAAAARGANNILGEQITKRDAELAKLRALALHNSKLLRHYVTGRHECILPFAIVEALDSLEAAGRGEG